jgi:hypothetical protein
MNLIKKMIEREYIGQDALFPTGNNSIIDFKKISSGEILTADIQQNRKASFLAKYWALAELTAHNSSTYDTKDKVHVLCSVKAGHVDIMLIDGQVVMTPKSIAFKHCSEKDFSDYYEKAIAIMADLLQCSISDLEENYKNFM